ncbi:MAG: DoxX family protein [Prevotella sp.]|jgi:putative oxidoreductase|nr:DoxX family protein [Prevotella sp.]
MKLLEKNTDLGILIIRLSIGILMLLHGVSKLMNGVGGIEQMLTGMGLPGFFAYGAYIGEVLASILIIIGFGTRAAALIFAFNMIVAVATAHAGDILTLSPQGGWAIELPALYFFGAIALAFTGGGKYALSNKYLWD